MSLEHLFEGITAELKTKLLERSKMAAELQQTAEGREHLKRLEIEQDLEWQREEEDRLRAESIKQAAVAFERCGLDPYTRKALETAYRQTSSIAEVESWVADRSAPWALVLVGSAGVGKSYAAAAWLKSSLSRTKKWMSCFDLQRMGLYHEDLDKILNCEALVLDDLGSEFADAKGMFEALIFNLIEHRMRYQKKTIITTNMDLDQLERRFGDRVKSRLKTALIVMSDGEDLRGT